MSLTPTHSMSAPRACAARKTLRPMRPNPLIPALKAIRTPFLRFVSCGTRNLPVHAGSGPSRWLFDVPVDDVHEQVATRGVDAGQVLGDPDRAMAPAGAA